MSRGNMQWSLLNSWQESFQDLVTGMLGMSLTAITAGFPYLIQADWTISEQSIRVPAMPRGSSACFVVYQQFLYAPGWLLTPLLFSRVRLCARSLGYQTRALWCRLGGRLWLCSQPLVRLLVPRRGSGHVSREDRGRLKAMRVSVQGESTVAVAGPPLQTFVPTQ